MLLSRLARTTAVTRHASRALSNTAPAPKVTQLLINGEFVNAKEGNTFETIDPRTGLSICRVQEATAVDANLAVAAAREAFDNGPWPRMSGRERGRIMNRFANLMEKHAEELAHLETLDNGKPLFFSKAADIPLSIDHIRYFAGWADKIHGLRRAALYIIFFSILF